MKLPKRPARIGSNAGDALIANLEDRRGLKRLFKGGLYQNAIVTARGEEVRQIAVVPVSCCWSFG